MFVAFHLLACWGSDEPLVRAVEPPRPTAEAIAEKRQREELRTSPRGVEINYQKPAGVYVDVHFLGGRKLTNVRDIVAEQLGSLLQEKAEDDGVRRLTFERGEVKLIDDELAVVDVPLPEPLRRSEALALLGFSPLADRYLALTFEFRVTQYQGFRRLVLHRVAREAEEVERITAYKRQEGASGRVPEP
jgi:hypothetical protein